MRLRHVLLLASGAGAAGALLLAADIHRRVQEAQREMVVNSTVPGHDSVIHFGDAHMLGLIALAFLFIAFFLLIFSEPLRKTAETTPPATSAITPPAPATPVSVPAPPRIEVSTVPAPVPVPAPQPEVVASEVHPAETVPAAATPMTDAPPPMSMPNTPSAAPQQPLSNDASAASGVSDTESSKAHER